MLSDSTPNINHVHLKMLLFFVRISIFFFTIQMSTGLHHVWCTSNSPMVALRCTQLNVNYVEWLLLTDVYMHPSYRGSSL